MDGVRKNANEVYDGKCFRHGVYCVRKWVNLFRKAILRNITFCDKKLMRSSLGVLSVIGR